MLYTLIDRITPEMLSKATYMCESSEGMSVLRYDDKIFYLSKSKYTPTCAPAVDDLYCVIKKKTNKAIITDSIREMMQAYLTDFSHSDKIASCKFDTVIETEIPNFIINTQIPLDIRLNIARPLVDETLKDVSIDEARKVELTTIVASTGTTEELMKLVDQMSTTPAIEGIEDTEEPEVEEELSDSDEDLNLTKIDMLYAMLSVEQVSLLQEYSVWSTQRIFNKATNGSTLTKSRKILQKKQQQLDAIRGNDDWAYAGWYKVKNGFHTCTLGHKLVNVHLAWRLKPGESGLDVSNLFWGATFNNKLEDLINSGDCIRFGSTCRNDFFNIEGEALTQLNKAQNAITSDLELMYDLYNQGMAQQYIDSYALLDPILNTLKLTDAKAMLVGNPYPKPIFESGTIQFFNRFKELGLLMPKSLVQLIRDNIMDWEGHYWTFNYKNGTDIHNIMHFASIDRLNLVLKFAFPDRYTNLSRFLAESGVRNKNINYSKYIARWASQDLIYHYVQGFFSLGICGLYQYTAEKASKDEGGTSKEARLALALVNKTPQELGFTGYNYEGLDALETLTARYFNIKDQLKSMLNSIKFTYTGYLLKNSYAYEVLPIIIENGKMKPIVLGSSVFSSDFDLEDYKQTYDLQTNSDHRSTYVRGTDDEMIHMAYIYNISAKKYSLYNNGELIEDESLMFCYPDKEDICSDYGMGSANKAVIDGIFGDSIKLTHVNTLAGNSLKYTGIKLTNNLLTECEKELAALDINAIQAYEADKHKQLGEKFLDKYVQAEIAKQNQTNLQQVPISTVADLVDFLSKNISKLDSSKHALNVGVIESASKYTDKNSISPKMLYRLKEAYQAITNQEAPEFTNTPAPTVKSFTDLADEPATETALKYISTQGKQLVADKDYQIIQSVLKYGRYSRNQGYAVDRALEAYKRAMGTP